jgi:enoyl-CoA hydratase/carnithine racemase
MTLEDGLRLEKLLIGDIMATEDVREGVKAFAEKRKPEYKAR